MCSACITSSPPAVNSAVEQSRRSLMFGECAERISTAPISSQAARRAPTRTWSETGSRPSAIGPFPGPARIVPASSTSAGQPGGSTRVASGSSNTHGPSARVPAAGSPRRTSASTHSPAKRTRRRPRSSSSPRRPGADLGPGLDQREADRDQLDRRLRVAVAVAALVLGGEALGELVRGGVGSGLDRQLEGLAAVAQLVDDLGARLREARGERLAQRSDLARDPLRRSARRRAASPCGRCRGGARRRAARAPRARRSPAGRGSARSRARRRSPPRASARRRRTASARTPAGRRRARP